MDAIRRDAKRRESRLWLQSDDLRAAMEEGDDDEQEQSSALEPQVSPDVELLTLDHDSVLLPGDSRVSESFNNAGFDQLYQIDSIFNQLIFYAVCI